ncbi:hypothetical protein TWF751_002901 [Orbilia oligospora]|nr:hypothetical protein TWF751_002901 [Orbilia oligospora]
MTPSLACIGSFQEIELPLKSSEKLQVSIPKLEQLARRSKLVPELRIQADNTVSFEIQHCILPALHRADK